ncbi:FliC/FljB family flagellin [Alcaligenes faecalis subsp. phenolicus]|uniref:FliC/FljB family flagellin n=1 Tax=Alcaligenes nematophilus TaxID=2994643 RepID=UPI002AA412B6|nr:FliC/FljB family flagellin [Alcaligenes phenolicus]
MSVINTNYLALVSQNNLTKSQNSLGTAIERLSSGLRINSAKDDAAGQAIANRFTANINGLTQAARNANDGISIAQTTEGALNEINENLQRIRTLTNQAVTDTNSASDLQSIQDEIDQRLGEINRISEQTQFNNVDVLAKTTTLNIQVGAHDGQTIEINLAKIDKDSLGLSSFTVAGGGIAAKVGDKVTAKVGGTDTEFTFSTTPATGAASKEVALPTTIADPAGVAAGGTNELVRAGESGDYYVKHTAADKSISYHKATIAVAEGTDAVTTPTPEDAKAPVLTVTAGAELTASELEEEGFSGTAKPLAAIDGALKQVDELRSHLGAIQNRFQSTVANLNNTVNNLSAARSRIEDADYAVEVSNMTRSQILQQAGTSVLAQANQVPQTVLSLLR